MAVGLFLVQWGLVTRAVVAGTTSGDRESQSLVPLLSPNLSLVEQDAVTAAFHDAVRRIDEYSSCRALFDDLVVDGRRALAKSFYEPAAEPRVKLLCNRYRAAAISVVNGDRVFLCRRFNRLTPTGKVAVLIHEALHGAGLSEAPLDPEAQTAAEITSMVKLACSISRR